MTRLEEFEDDVQTINRILAHWNVVLADVTFPAQDKKDLLGARDRMTDVHAYVSAMCARTRAMVDYWLPTPVLALSPQEGGEALEMRRQRRSLPATK